MTADPADAPADAPPRSPRWPWFAFVLAAAWAVAVRAPLILNAADHLDSDLAVDGLTLLDVTRGHWRWHYPGTPFMGIGPVLLSLPQAAVWGASPVTLVSGGTVAYLGLMLATFLLARRAFGAVAASWSLAPLAFASNGAVWLSGRITGGHLVAAVWHAGAFALLVPGLERGRWRDAAALGLWCGLGLYLDSMFAVTLAGLLPAAVVSWLVGGAWRRGPLLAVVFSLFFLAGAWLRPVGARLDPHDAYRDQFALADRPDVLLSHAGLLVKECLPRLLAGYRFPDILSDPAPGGLTEPGVPRFVDKPDPVAIGVVAVTVVVTGLSVFGLARAAFKGPSRASRTVAAGLTLSALATLAGFVVNRNIFNSDNYRYLVSLLVPWSLGFGASMSRIEWRGKQGLARAALYVAAYAVLPTWGLWRWYAGFGWVDDRGAPVRAVVQDPAIGWLDEHPEVTWIEGGYWDVYRLAFLTGGRVRGVPFPVYPNRFPEWRPEPGAGEVMFIRRSPEGREFRARAQRDGYRVAYRAPGVLILKKP